MSNLAGWRRNTKLPSASEKRHLSAFGFRICHGLAAPSVKQDGAQNKLPGRSVKVSGQLAE
jgi:hypothetical protein